ANRNNLISAFDICIYLNAMIQTTMTSLSCQLFPYTTLFRSRWHRKAIGSDAVTTPPGAIARDERARRTAPESRWPGDPAVRLARSEEHTSELQSPYDLVCRLLLEKKNECKEENHHYQH